MPLSGPNDFPEFSQGVALGLIIPALQADRPEIDKNT
jgi:hypothetical protein